MTRFTIDNVIKTILKFWSLSNEMKNSNRPSASRMIKSGFYSIVAWMLMWMSSIVAVLTFQLLLMSIICSLYSALIIFWRSTRLNNGNESGVLPVILSWSVSLSDFLAFFEEGVGFADGFGAATKFKSLMEANILFWSMVSCESFLASLFFFAESETSWFSASSYCFAFAPKFAV